MLTVKGHNGTVHFDGQTVHIERSGFFARATVGVGEKRIPIHSINAVQWKNAGFSYGFIQFTVSGGTERRSKFGSQSKDAMGDENSVTFHTNQQPAFEQLRAAIDAAITQRHAPQAAAPAPSHPPALIADELAKLGQLVQQGILTQAEFAQQKARLLGG
ncbi:DUF4429 domain-containing protein [Streptomyces sp. NPDC060194]|uniref:DUF4429 domain-containing protein n=1 Tax=Streptomyces sp. NPDC060194 TaxID=3347069 RepID=UPI0036556A82